MITAAVMQPYFVPYAGYFSLIASVDVFVVLDCVQFPRRGWVHRNRLADASGSPRWLTLPIEKAPRDVKIRDLLFRPNAADEMAEQAKSFPVLLEAAGDELVREVLSVSGKPADYLVRLLRVVCLRLELSFNDISIDSLRLDRSLKGQDLIMAAAESAGATRYLNLPGGRSLYDPAAFGRRGMSLGFLPAYSGPDLSILYRLLTEDPRLLREDILRHAGGAEWPA
jgi:hypothetical protein